MHKNYKLSKYFISIITTGFVVYVGYHIKIKLNLKIFEMPSKA